MALEVGSVLQGKYRIVTLIGKGGMGAVYEGENTLIARRVAIKVLHAELGAHPDAIERFEREAQAAGRIGNDHILEVLDLGQLPSGERFMVMEYLDGETLEDRISRGVLTPQEIYPLVRQLLLGLSAAHGKGIIHRDLKPENVFILDEKAGHQDYVKIIDFGISKFVGSVDLRMTATGAVMGTPYYMSPEQAKGSKGIDPRSDLYAVGVILYRAVTGHVPFAGENFNEILFKIVLSELARPSEIQPLVDAGFESIIMRAMAREPESRFQTAADFADALDAWHAEGRGVSAPPPERGSLTSYPSMPPGTIPAGSVNGNVTAGEWTQSGIPASRKSSALTWFFLTLLVGGAALGAMFFFLDDPVPPPEASPAIEPQIAELTGGSNEGAETGGNGTTGAAPDATDVDVTREGGKGDAADSTEDEKAEDGEQEAEEEEAATAKPAAKRPRPRRRPVRQKRPEAPKEDKPAGDELDFGY